MSLQNLAAEKTYNDLEISLGEALKRRSSSQNEVITQTNKQVIKSDGN